MTYQRAVGPRRTDLRTRRERVAAKAFIRGLDSYERPKSRLLIDVIPPDDHPFFGAPMFDDGNLLSGIPFGAVIGMSRGFPEVDLNSVLTPEGKAMVVAAADMNMEQLVAGFPFVRWSDHLTVSSVFEIPGMSAAFEANRLGQNKPMTSLHLYHAVHDKYPAIADVDKIVKKYRHEGIDVTYRRFRIGGHMTVALTGVPGSLRFLSDRFTEASCGGA